MKNKVWIITLSILVIWSFGCATRKVSIPTTTTASIQVVKPEIIEPWQIEWDKTLQAARKEARVVIYGSSPIPSINKAATQFEFSKKYGFVPEFIAGRGAEISNRIFNERRAGLFIVDVLISGMNTFFGQLKPAGIADPLDPALILREVVDPNLWYGGKLRWGDAQHLVYMPFAFSNANLAINTELVNPNDIKSYRDLLNPKWKGKILLNDPTIAGTSLKGFGVLGFKILDLDFFRNLAKQEPIIMKDERLLVDWLAKGKYYILLFPHLESMREYVQAGAPVAYITPAEGTYLSAGGANIVLVNKAPHLHAAKIFINWYLTKEGQTLVSRIHGSQSARVDIPTEGLTSVMIRQPNTKYFLDADTEEWLARDQDFIKAARDIFGPLMR